MNRMFESSHEPRAMNRGHTGLPGLITPIAFTICALLACWTARVIGAPVEPENVPDYSDWYQIEVIVFAPHHASGGDEAWPAADISYPPAMLAIAPSDPSELQPHNLWQLDLLLGGRPGTTATTEDAGVEEQFLFERRSRFHNAAAMIPETTPGAGGDEIDIEPVDLTELLDTDLPAPFQAVDAEERNLNGIARSLNRSSRYRLLKHIAWRQPVPVSDENSPVLIQAGERYADRFEVDGTLTVRRSRYLHVDADLWYTQFVQKYEQESPMPDIVSRLDSATLRQYPDLVEAARRKDNYLPIQAHTMRVSRRMRSSTLHYLDHPYFGVLIQIDDFTYTPPESAGLVGR